MKRSDCDGSAAKIVPRLGVSTRSQRDASLRVVRNLCRRLLGSGKHVVDGGSELGRPGARDDDGISPAMGFLGNAKESPAIIFAEFHIKVFPLDLDLLRFDNIVHVGREFGRLSGLVEAKNSLNLTTQKGNVWPRLFIGGVCVVTDPGPASGRRSQNQFVA